MGDARTENREINYVTGPVGMLFRRLLPSAIGSLLNATVASLIDVVILSYFLGPSMLAVVELCMPVYMLVNTLAMLISSGAATLYAHSLGEGDREEALRWFSASTIHMLICELVCRRVKDSVDAFAAGAPQADDITMLCLHYRGQNT